MAALGHRASNYDTITGYSLSEVATVCEHPVLSRWIYRGSHRRRRMRILLSCIWYHDMECERWYTTEELTQLCAEHDSRGPSAMVISNQRVGTLLRVLIARELVQFRVVKGKREYLKGEKYENEMLQV